MMVRIVLFLCCLLPMGVGAAVPCTISRADMPLPYTTVEQLESAVPLLSGVVVVGLVAFLRARSRCDNDPWISAAVAGGVVGLVSKLVMYARNLAVVCKRWKEYFEAHAPESVADLRFYDQCGAPPAETVRYYAAHRQRFSDDKFAHMQFLQYHLGLTCRTSWQDERCLSNVVKEMLYGDSPFFTPEDRIFFLENTSLDNALQPLILMILEREALLSSRVYERVVRSLIKYISGPGKSLSAHEIRVVACAVRCGGEHLTVLGKYAQYFVDRIGFIEQFRGCSLSVRCQHIKNFMNGVSDDHLTGSLFGALCKMYVAPLVESASGEVGDAADSVPMVKQAVPVVIECKDYVALAPVCDRFRVLFCRQPREVVCALVSVPILSVESYVLLFMTYPELLDLSARELDYLCGREICNSIPWVNSICVGGSGSNTLDLVLIGINPAHRILGNGLFLYYWLKEDSSMTFREYIEKFEVGTRRQALTQYHEVCA